MEATSEPAEPAAAAPAPPAKREAPDEAEGRHKRRRVDGEREERESSFTPEVAKAAAEAAAAAEGGSSAWLQVDGLKKYDTAGIVRKKLEKAGFEGARANKAVKKRWAFVRFGSPDDLERGWRYLETEMGLSVRLRDMSASSRPGGGARRGDGGKPKTVVEQLTPLHHKPYEEQLKEKEEGTRTALKKTVRQLRKLFRFMKEWNKARPDTFAALEPIMPAPHTESYRNKSDFTIGPGEDGSTLAVGFLLGSFNRGVEAVAPPDEVCIVPAAHAEVARRIAEGLVRPSDLPAYERSNHTGVWRRAMVRTSDTSKQMMVLVQVQGKDLEPAALDALRQRVKEFATSQLAEVGGFTLRSLFFQVWDGNNNAVPDGHPTELLSGEPCIEETVLGRRFLLSWGSFFQVNTPAAENLYRLAGDWALDGGAGAGTQKTVLLDVCCGTGTIGLTLADRFDQVAGFEIVESAVEDARKNAARNGVSNATYFLGPAEETLHKYLEELPSNVRPVAIVDPPRNGLHDGVLKALRRCTRLERIVYVSCNPNSMAADLVKLARPRGGKHSHLPFKGVRARPVDMFPHTAHCELVVSLERCTAAEAETFDDPNWAGKMARKAERYAANVAARMAAPSSSSSAAAAAAAPAEEASK